MDSITQQAFDTLESVQDTIKTNAIDISGKVIERTTEFRAMLPDTSSLIDNTKQSIEKKLEASTSTLREAIGPIADDAGVKVEMMKQATMTFVDERLHESKVDADKASISTMTMAFMNATYAWLLSQFYVMSSMLMDRLLEYKPQNADNDCAAMFYMQWAYTLIFAIYEASFRYLPVDRIMFEKRCIELKGDYVDPVLTKTSEIVDEVVTRVEPLKDATDKVEGYVRETFVGDILEKSLSTLMSLNKKEECESDTSDSSPVVPEKSSPPISSTESVPVIRAEG